MTQHPEVLRDLRLGTGQVTDRATVADRAEWLQASWAFATAEAGQEGAPKPKRLQRVAAFDFGLALDHAILASTGKGLAHFAEPQEERDAWPPNPKDLSPAILTLSVDQGSIGFAWVWYAVGPLRLRLLPLFDPLHRSWNDTKGAIGAAGLWTFVLLHTICCNAFHGPWNGAAFWEQARDAAKLYYQRAGPNDPFFQALLPKLLADKGLSGRESDPELAREVFESLLDDPCWQSQGPKVALSRWYGFLSAAEAYDASWTVRLLVLTFLGHQLGFATPRAQCLLQEKLDQMRDEGQPAARGPVARGNDSLLQVRKLCKNTLHLVLTLLADPGHRLKARLLAMLTAPHAIGARLGQHAGPRPPGLQGLLRGAGGWTGVAGLEPSGGSAPRPGCSPPHGLLRGPTDSS